MDEGGNQGVLRLSDRDPKWWKPAAAIAGTLLPFSAMVNIALSLVLLVVFVVGVGVTVENSEQ